MSAPPKCQSLLNISNAYNNSSNNFSNNCSNFCNTTDRRPTPKEVKPLFPIEIPKVKSEQEKTELEKVFSVKLNSESDANQVTKVISDLTQSVAQYHMKGMTPEKRQQFKKQHQID